MQKRPFFQLFGAGAVALTSLGMSWEARAEWQPDQPVTLIVPYAAGGGTDIVARALIDVINNNDLSPQPWVAVNRPGGGGMTALQYMADHADDPLTLTMLTSSGMTSAMLQEQLGLSWKQLTPIANLILDVEYLVTHQESQFKTLDDVIEYADANPGQLRVGGAAIGTEDHLVTLMMQNNADLEVRYVAHQGGGEVKQNIAGGHLDVAWLNPSEMRGFLVDDGGTVVPLGVAWAEREEEFPDVPTFKEEGYDVVFDSFFRGVLGPKNLTEDQVAFYAGVIRQATDHPDWQQALVDQGLPGQYIGAADYQAALERWDAELSELMPMVREAQ
jgi:putative tricarboxylic transport membrane protein